jgi:hypothetical protein
VPDAFPSLLRNAAMGRSRRSYAGGWPDGADGGKALED